ncbi:hypothetical protein ACCS68_31985 [Rhizobium beringeri]|uniref:WYL domain-containing protein n=1 Tax=Rhizobium beringeri TaxID=3019934 RepID=UPI003CF44152
MTINDLKYAQRERVIFLDRCLTWRGAANRRDLIDRFRISSAQAAIDFRTYLQLAPVPPDYDPVRKAYIARANHQSLMTPSLTTDIEVLEDAEDGESGSASVPRPFRQADAAIVARLYNVMRTGKAIHVSYTSMTTGADEGQWLAPVRFTSDGENVHLRAFSFKHQAYRDYLPIRFSPSSSFDERQLEQALPLDEEWRTRARIFLRPHAGLSAEQAAVVSKEYGFSGELLVVVVRQAMEFYLKRRWRLEEKNARLQIVKIEHEPWDDGREG